MPLNIRGNEPLTVFALHGVDENSATYALGSTLERSAAFKSAFVQAITGDAIDVSNALLLLQEHGDDGGFTDLEIRIGQDLHLIIEAKKGWLTPTIEQLTRYRPRLAASGAQRHMLISLSSARADIVQRTLPTDLDGTPVMHMSWRDVQRVASATRRSVTRPDERTWLDQLINHLGEFVAMDRSNDNSVFVVSLGAGTMVEGGTHTWIDVVEQERRYFHAVGRTWPTQPPNYIGFRYRGCLQSVHHIDSFVIATDVSTINPSWLQTNVDHFVYSLGPAMKPAVEIRTGAINRNARCYCAIDTLLSGAFPTIGHARDETKRRKEIAA